MRLQVVQTREPGGTTLGRRLRRELLRGGEVNPMAEMLLYAADRAQHVAELILPALEQGKTVLCDRFSDSTMAYQGFGRGLDQSLIARLNAVAQQGVPPDLTLWLDLPVEVGLARVGSRGERDRFELEDVRFHERVRAGFQWLAEQEPGRIVRLDATLSPTDLVAAAWAEIEKRLLPLESDRMSKAGSE